MGNELITECKDLLSENKNLILTGAPGTGKTYLAKEIAQLLIFGNRIEDLPDDEKAEAKKQFNDQVGFVQFHPSYDYTDFVEGLRPIQKENVVGFEHKNGVFKDFCDKACENYKNSHTDEDTLAIDASFEDVYYSLIQDIKQNKVILYYSKRHGDLSVSLDTKQEKIEFEVKNGKPKHTQKDYLRVLFRCFYKTEINKIQNLSQDNINEVIAKDDSFVTSKVDYIQYRWALSMLVKKYKEKKDATTNTTKEEKEEEDATTDITKEEEKIFVFIIDEINRGEISKIFGELFFSIDPGYRGVKGKVSTQYQNLIKDDDDDNFKTGFFVPENVYIIGTMNDIDRSVESMDFAFRRRFAFKEIKASENIGMLNSLGDKEKEAINRMTNLNKAIEGIEGLSSAYHIGASYFLKLNNYKDNKFEQLWEYHIEGLLREYLRGYTDVNNLIENLKNAYDDDNNHDEVKTTTTTQDVASENN